MRLDDLETTRTAKPEVVDDSVTRLFCVPGDANDLRSAIASLSTDGLQRTEMRRTGRERFEQYSMIERTISQTSDFSTALAYRKGPRSPGARWNSDRH